MRTDPAPALELLRSLLDPAGFVAGPDVQERYLVDVRGTVVPPPPALLRPTSTQQVSRVLAACHAQGLPVAVQGGRTGLVMAQLPQPGELLLSLERMNRIESIDAGSGLATVQAGVVLQALQEQVEAAGLMFPLDLGARGSCTIGGNIATNAGGNRVIRYGMTRELVVGLEVVLADGTVLEGLRPYLKNNTGIDLKQLFIGSEGVLGVVTRALLRLFPQPAERAVALCAVSGFAEVRRVLALCREQLAGALTSFEVMWRMYYERAVPLAGTGAPLGTEHPFYVLVEASGSAGSGVHATLERTLQAALEEGAIADVAIAQSQAQAGKLWQPREISVETGRTLRPTASFDVSLAIERMDDFVNELQRMLAALHPDCHVLVFGHLGDGNLHLVAHVPDALAGGKDEVERSTYVLLQRYGGSVSAEHGIGLSKRAALPCSRTPAELATMRTLKRALDPKGILNPGRIVQVDG
jgi:FAD/FMN-containing dehydrogenase